MTILGLDPGLADCGWGVIRTAPLAHVAHGCIHTRAGGTESSRVEAVTLAVADLMARYALDAVAVEAYVAGGYARGGRPRQSSSIAVARVIGAVCELCRARGLAAAEYSAATWKPAVRGRGKRAWGMGWAVKLRLGLEREPKPEHAADALGVALFHEGLARVGRAA